MSADSQKGYGSTLALIALGVLALYGGVQWLMVLIPAAFLIWYAAARPGVPEKPQLTQGDDRR